MSNRSSNKENKDYNGNSRREFLFKMAFGSAGVMVSPYVQGVPPEIKKEELYIVVPEKISISLSVNGQNINIEIDTRTTLLDLLREKLSLNGTKKGCDRGQCGACTILLNGERVNSCLILAASCNHGSITTIEGLSNKTDLHPMQKAFIKHDAFQCGYCTPGQICSAIGLIHEGHAKTTAEIKEQMSGNICRCGAYLNIVDAIQEVRSGA